jgi:hypothetical protein
MLEQSGQVGIGQLVVDDEAGIDGNLTFRRAHHNGIRMPADPVAAFIDGDLVALAQEPCRRHAGNSGADNRYAFLARRPALHHSPLFRRRQRVAFSRSACKVTTGPGR